MQKQDLEYKKLVIETNKMLADIRHDVKKEMHWEANRNHWDKQQKYWRYVFILGLLAVIVNALKPLWSNA